MLRMIYEKRESRYGSKKQTIRVGICHDGGSLRRNASDSTYGHENFSHYV
jgi:hypothetical protein